MTTDDGLGWVLNIGPTAMSGFLWCLSD